MTIQSTVLLGVAGMLMSSAASAQCYRQRPIVIPHAHHHHDYGLQSSNYRPYLLHTPPVPHTQVAPAPAEGEFGACAHVQDLASRLEVLMNEFCFDLYYNYSHNIDFHPTYAEAYSLYQTAVFIRNSVHDFDREAVCAQLAGADALFKHVKQNVCHWTRIHRRQVGTLDIDAKMDLAEVTLCRLMEDVGVHVTPALESAPPPALETAPHPGTTAPPRNNAPLPPVPGL